MQALLVKAAEPRVELPIFACDADAGIGHQAAALFLDAGFVERLDALRSVSPRHPGFGRTLGRCVEFCREFELLNGTDLSRALADILLFPAYALPGVSDDELAVLGKFWAFVFHVDDVFDERVTAEIAERVARIEDSGAPSGDQFEALGRVSQEFEQRALLENQEFARILSGGTACSEDPLFRAVEALRDELIAVLMRRHALDRTQALLLSRPFADSFFRLFDARTGEIRKRVNRRASADELEYNAMRLYTIAMEPLLEASFLFFDTGQLHAVSRLRRSVAFEQLMHALRLQIAYVNDLVSIAKELREPNLDNIALAPIVNEVGREALEGWVNGYQREPDPVRRGELRQRLNRAVNQRLADCIGETCACSNALLAQVVHWSGLLDATNSASSAVAATVMSWIRAHYLYTFEIARYAETIPLVSRTLSEGRPPRWDIDSRLESGPVGTWHLPGLSPAAADDAVQADAHKRA